MEILIISVVAILVILFSKTILLGMSRQKQIFNILYGKYTFDNLDVEEKKAVIVVSLNILYRGGCKNSEDKIKKLNSSQKYGVYALAMTELGISPTIGKVSWFQYLFIFWS